MMLICLYRERRRRGHIQKKTLEWDSVLALACWLGWLGALEFGALTHVRNRVVENWF